MPPTTTDEKAVIIALMNDLNVTILPAAKGGATIVLMQSLSTEKAIQQLSATTTHLLLTPIQKTQGRCVQEKVLPQTTARAISQKETSIARAYDRA